MPFVPAKAPVAPPDPDAIHDEFERAANGFSAYLEGLNRAASTFAKHNQDGSEKVAGFMKDLLTYGPAAMLTSRAVRGSQIRGAKQLLERETFIAERARLDAIKKQYAAMAKSGLTDTLDAAARKEIADEARRRMLTIGGAGVAGAASVAALSGRGGDIRIQDFRRE